eukprot:UN31736
MQSRLFGLGKRRFATWVEYYAQKQAKRMAKLDLRSRNEVGATKRPFIDSVRIVVQSGKGGDGMASFEQYLCKKGMADGGNGGAGANVVITSKGMNYQFNRIKKSYKGVNGTNGAKKNMHGKNGESTIINVPVGTVVKEITSKAYFMEQYEERPTFDSIPGPGNMNMWIK